MAIAGPASTIACRSAGPDGGGCTPEQQVQSSVLACCGQLVLGDCRTGAWVHPRLVRYEHLRDHPRHGSANVLDRLRCSATGLARRQKDGRKLANGEFDPVQCQSLAVVGFAVREGDSFSHHESHDGRNPLQARVRAQAGSVTVAFTPPIARLASVTSPPCARRMFRAIGNPSPTPPVSLLRDGSPRWNGSKTRSSSPGDMPGPSSSTSTTSMPPSDGGRRVTRAHPP